jgi:lipopolysaccharide/colanic/teichoic acid biosynthesis glycosyltransferase
MSVIGPRPERPGITGDLDTKIPFFAERTYGVRPGITGLAQVYNGYDETLEDARQKAAYDHAYAITLSRPLAWMLMDLRIIFKTIQVVVGAKGQ